MPRDRTYGEKIRRELSELNLQAEAVARIVLAPLPSPLPVASVPVPLPAHGFTLAFSDRLLAGRKAAALEGKHQSGPAPYGYQRDYARSRYDRDGTPLVPLEQEAAVVQRVFREYLRDKSIRRIMKRLNEDEIRTRRGSLWSQAGIAWILHNRTYVGRVKFGEIDAPGRHQAIVTQITFNRVQVLLREQDKKGRGYVKLKGQLRGSPCGGCGEPVAGARGTTLSDFVGGKIMPFHVRCWEARLALRGKV